MLSFHRIIEGENFSIAESLDFKFYAIMNALVLLSHRTVEIERTMAWLHNDGTSVITHSRAYQAQIYEKTSLSSIQ